MSQTDGFAAFPGFAITAADLRALGFVPLLLDVRSTAIELPFGQACEWITVGDIRKGPGDLRLHLRRGR